MYTKRRMPREKVGILKPSGHPIAVATTPIVKDHARVRVIIDMSLIPSVAWLVGNCSSNRAKHGKPRTTVAINIAIASTTLLLRT